MATFSDMKKGFYRVTGGIAGVYAGMVGGGVNAARKVLEGKPEEALQAFGETVGNVTETCADWTEKNGDDVATMAATVISIASGIKNIGDHSKK